MTRDEEPDRKVTRRTALKKGAIAAGVFTVGGIPASTVAAADKGTGVLRKRDFENGYEIGSVLTAVETVDDIVVEQPVGLQGDRTRKFEEANLIKRPLHFDRGDPSCPPEAPDEDGDGKPPCGRNPQGGRAELGSNVLTEFWPSNGVTEVGSKLKIVDAEELSADAALNLQGPNGIVESTTEPMVKVTFEKLPQSG